MVYDGDRNDIEYGRLENWEENEHFWVYIIQIGQYTDILCCTIIHYLIFHSLKHILHYVRVTLDFILQIHVSCTTGILRILMPIRDDVPLHIVLLAVIVSPFAITLFGGPPNNI